MATTAGTILIPVLQSTEVIEVQISELPDDVGEVLEILMNELAPLEVWLRFAVEYYRQGKHDSFLKMFQPLLDEHARGNLFDQFGDTKQTREQFLAILNALAAFHTVMGSRERDKTKKKAEFEKAKRFYDSAEGVDLLKGSANVGRAVLQLAKGQLGAAEKTLTDLGDKVDAAKKSEAEGLIGEVREALKGEDQTLLKEKGEALARLMSEIGTAAYQQGQAEGANGAESGEPTPASEETIEGEAKEV